MTDETAKERTTHDYVYELALRGLIEMAKDKDQPPQKVRKYGDAFDEFGEEIGVPHLIRDQHDAVQDIWMTYLEERL